MATPTRPTVARQSSRLPGGFDTDDDLSPIKTSFVEDLLDHPETSPHPHDTAVNKSTEGDNGSHHKPSDDGESMMQGENDTIIQEKEMRRRLEDMDSTFLQEVSPVARTSTPLEGDISVVEEPNPQEKAAIDTDDHSSGQRLGSHAHHEADDPTPKSPVTPPGMYYTPAPNREEQLSRDDLHTQHGDDHANMSSLETMSSSPTAAAAARTVSRAVSSVSMGSGYETADDTQGGIRIDHEATPRNSHPETSSQAADSPTPTKGADHPLNASQADTDGGGADLRSPTSRQRPKFLNSHMASQRSSYSSYTTTSTEGGSDVTLGADFALQSGGAVPQGSIISTRPTSFSRSISLGSMASGISDPDEGDDRIRPNQGGLHTLDEEDDTPRRGIPGAGGDSNKPQTPRSTQRNVSTPTETVIAQHVKDVQVPPTLAREYSSRQRQSSPEKRSAAPSAAGRNSKNLTLKEQSSTIDRLVKENFDLKLKITFLDEALNRRSDEGVKAMISENVDLRTAKFKSAKETRELRRSMRDLERKLKEKSDELAQKNSASPPVEAEPGPDAEAFQELEDEVIYLRERVTTYEFDLEKMRNESSVQEIEKKKLAEVVRRVGDTSRSTDVGTREEVVSLVLLGDQALEAEFTLHRTYGKTYWKQRQHAENKRTRITEGFEKKLDG